MENRLRVLRAESRWSQQELATRVGVSRQTINAIEAGRSEPSLTLAFRIADAFGRRIDEIFLPEPAGAGAGMVNGSESPSSGAD